MSVKTRARVSLLGMLVLLGCATFSLNSLGPKTAFVGGTYEASGVVHVPGTEAVLFVDDGSPNEIFWMRLDERGKQSGAIKPVRLGVSVTDLEGITTDGKHFFVVGSQSKLTGTEQAGLLRFKFNVQSQQVEAVETINGLKRFLAENVAELRNMGGRSYEDGGINVEAVAWNPQSDTLLLGLRSPVIDGQALVVPLRMRDPNSAFASSNLEVIGGKAIRLTFGGAGIRSLEYDDITQSFRMLTGAAMDREKTIFKLWESKMDSSNPALFESDAFDPKLKPEGVTRASVGMQNFTFVVFDTSGYTTLH